MAPALRAKACAMELVRPALLLRPGFAPPAVLAAERVVAAELALAAGRIELRLAAEYQPFGAARSAECS